MKAIQGLFLVFLVALTSGCATTGDLQQVRKAQLKLRSELETVRNKQARMLADFTRMRVELQKVRRIFDSFRKKGQYNFANIGVKMDELRTHHQELLGKYQVTKLEFDKLKKKFDKLLKAYGSRFGDPTDSGKAGAIPANISEQDLYKAAKALFDVGKYRAARERLKVFRTRFPKSDLNDDALLMIGDCFTKLGKHFQAIIRYNDVYRKYKKGDKADLALLRLGEAHFRINACAEGKAFLKRLIRSYRRSSYVSDARQLLRNSRSLCKKKSG